jgi:hypothetical protein
VSGWWRSAHLLQPPQATRLVGASCHEQLSARAADDSHRVDRAVVGSYAAAALRLTCSARGRMLHRSSARNCCLVM